MEERKDNVTQFPNQTAQAEATPQISEEEKANMPSPDGDDQRDPEIDQRSYFGMIKQMGEMIKIMEQSWKVTQNEFKLTDSHMKALYKYNEEHRTPMPENLTKEEQDKWDHFNGLNDIPEEKVLEIFGEGHPIIGVQHSQTIDRIKSVVSEFFGYLSSLKEYKQVHEAYLMLVEENERNQIQQLKNIMEAETDPEKKAKMKESIDKYYDRRYINFITEPLDDNTIDSLVKGFSDKEKITYWLNRAQDKLKQLGISSRFILEISQFEKRFLAEKYHKLSNMILLYVIRLITYTDCARNSKDADSRNKIISIVMALDKLVQNRWSADDKEIIIKNLSAFLEQFIDNVNYETAVSKDYKNNETAEEK